MIAGGVYFVAGGHGAMWDLASDATLAKMLGSAADTGKIVAAVCHGPAALLQAKLANGTPIVKDAG
jgi:putative intracellular protease/amidase